jgi:hypothetical protein
VRSDISLVESEQRRPEFVRLLWCHRKGVHLGPNSPIVPDDKDGAPHSVESDMELSAVAIISAGKTRGGRNV